MDPSSLIQQLADKPATGAYLVCGGEEFWKSRVVGALKGSVLVEENEWNLAVFDGGQVDGETVAAAVATIPFFGSRRVVLVRDVERLKSEAASKIADLAVDIPEFSVLILLGGAVDKRGKLWKEFNRIGRAIECAPVDPRRLPGWLLSYLRTLGYQITPGAVRLIAGLFTDLSRLVVELEKVITYKGNDTKITEDDIRAVVSLSSGELTQYAIFDFVDSLAENRISEALQLLGNLLTAGQDPLGVLSMISRQFRLILRAQGIRATGGGQAALESELGLRQFAARKIWRQAAGVSEERAVLALWHCFQADLRIKNGADANRALEQLVVQLSNTSAKHPQNEKRP